MPNRKMVMPRLKDKSGKTKHYAYTQAGQPAYRKARDAKRRKAKKGGVK